MFAAAQNATWHEKAADSSIEHNSHEHLRRVGVCIESEAIILPGLMCIELTWVLLLLLTIALLLRVPLSGVALIIPTCRSAHTWSKPMCPTTT